MADIPFDAYRWETPSVSIRSQEKDFSFAVINSPYLQRSPDFETFKEHFKMKDTVVTSPNLSGDATMIIPTPSINGESYCHLGEFIKKAPNTVQSSLWKTSADKLLELLKQGTYWLNTAGAGVAWLHLRIDSRPKYYSYAPYKSS